ncbi:MAG: JAB domain-containing protein [Desulfovibrionaceae bacterium]
MNMEYNVLLQQFLHYAFRRYKKKDFLVKITEEHCVSLLDILFLTEDDLYFLQENPRKTLYNYILITRELCIRSMDMPYKTIIKEDTFLHFIHMLYIRLHYLKTESILAIMFNKRKAFISIENIAIGSDRKAFFDTKLLLQKLRVTKSTYCIIGHNHPSGIEQPSQEDIEITKQLVKELHIHSFSLIDHVIITPHTIYSILQEKIIATKSR